MIISLNGMDNAGKSTQGKILTTMYPEIFRAVLHINNMPSFDKEKCDSNWWFRPDNKKDFVITILKCLKERIELANTYQDGIVLFDKGYDFYIARILSTLIIKGLAYKEAEQLLLELQDRYIDTSHETLKLLIESGRHKRVEISRETSEALRYNAYTELNKLIFYSMKIDYIYIPANDIVDVTATILSTIKYNLGDDGYCNAIRKKL